MYDKKIVKDITEQKYKAFNEKIDPEQKHKLSKDAYNKAAKTLLIGGMSSASKPYRFDNNDKMPSEDLERAVQSLKKKHTRNKERYKEIQTFKPLRAEYSGVDNVSRGAQYSKLRIKKYMDFPGMKEAIIQGAREQLEKGAEILIEDLLQQAKQNLDTQLNKLQSSNKTQAMAKCVFRLAKAFLKCSGQVNKLDETSMIMQTIAIIEITEVLNGLKYSKLYISDYYKIMAMLNLAIILQLSIESQEALDQQLESEQYFKTLSSNKEGLTLVANTGTQALSRSLEALTISNAVILLPGFPLPGALPGTETKGYFEWVNKKKLVDNCHCALIGRDSETLYDLDYISKKTLQKIKTWANSEPKKTLVVDITIPVIKKPDPILEALLNLRKELNNNFDILLVRSEQKQQSLGLGKFASGSSFLITNDEKRRKQFDAEAKKQRTMDQNLATFYRENVSAEVLDLVQEQSENAKEFAEECNDKDIIANGPFIIDHSKKILDPSYREGYSFGFVVKNWTSWIPGEKRIDPGVEPKIIDKHDYEARKEELLKLYNKPFANLIIDAIKDSSSLHLYTIFHESKILNDQTLQSLKKLAPSTIKRLVHALSMLQKVDKKLITLEHFNLFITHAQHSSLFANSLSNGISILYKTDQKLITQNNSKFLAEHAENAESIANGISILYKADQKLITQENFKLLSEHKGNAESIANGYSILYKADPKLITPDNLKLLTQHPKCAMHITSILSTYPNLITPENYKLLAEHAQDAYFINDALYQLKNPDSYDLQTHYKKITIITPENFKLLVKHAEHASSIVDAFHHLQFADYGIRLITPENFKFLAENAEHAKFIADDLRDLYRADPNLITPENSKLLAEQHAQHSKHTSNIIYALSTLYRTGPELINPETRKLLAKHAEQAKYIADTWSTIHKANPNLITQENFKLLSDMWNAKHVDFIARGVSILHKANPNLITSKNLKLLLQDAYISKILITLNNFIDKKDLITPENFKLLAKHAEFIDDSLGILHDTNLSLITQENFKLLAAHGIYAKTLAKILSILHRAKLITPDNFQLLTENAENAEFIAAELSALYNADPKHITSNNFKLLVEHTRTTAINLSTLHEENPNITPENRKSSVTRTMFIKHRSPIKPTNKNKKPINKNKKLTVQTQKKVVPGLKNLYSKINIMRDYGISLQDLKEAKGRKVIDHANSLEKNADIFFSQSLNKQPTNTDIEEFITAFTILLHKKDAEMKAHRQIWKPIIANILIALTGIGLLAIAIKAGANLFESFTKNTPFNFKNSLFFTKTKTEQKAEDIKEAATALIQLNPSRDR